MSNAIDAPEADDHIVLGAGSAGCVLASRLTEDGVAVLLLEAGPSTSMQHPAAVRVSFGLECRARLRVQDGAVEVACGAAWVGYLGQAGRQLATKQCPQCHARLMRGLRKAGVCTGSAANCTAFVPAACPAGQSGISRLQI